MGSKASPEGTTTLSSMTGASECQACVAVSNHDKMMIRNWALRIMTWKHYGSLIKYENEINSVTFNSNISSHM